MVDVKTRNALYTVVHFGDVCNIGGGENIEASLAFVFFVLSYFSSWVDKI